MKTVIKELSVKIKVTVEVPETEEEANALEYPDSTAKVVKLEINGNESDPTPHDIVGRACERQWTVVDDYIDVSGGDNDDDPLAWLGLILALNVDM